MPTWRDQRRLTPLLGPLRPTELQDSSCISNAVVLNFIELAKAQYDNQKAQFPPCVLADAARTAQRAPPLPLGPLCPSTTALVY